MLPIIEARNFRKNYGSFEAVKDINFAIPKSTCFGFLGPNGAGKTTTMSMLYCYVTITSGELSIAGLNPKKNQRKIKEVLGVVPQDNNLDRDLSVYENLSIYAQYFGISHKKSKEKIYELLDFFNLTQKKDVR